MKLPRAPPLAPTTPDVLKTSMFGGGGMAHHMYPRVQHVSRLHLETSWRTPHVRKGSEQVVRASGIEKTGSSFSTAYVQHGWRKREDQEIDKGILQRSQLTEFPQRLQLKDYS